jgi:hypothetical protein
MRLLFLLLGLALATFDIIPTGANSCSWNKLVFADFLSYDDCEAKCVQNQECQAFTLLVNNGPHHDKPSCVGFSEPCTSSSPDCNGGVSDDWWCGYNIRRYRFAFQLRGKSGGEKVEIEWMPKPSEERWSYGIQKVTLTKVWKTFKTNQQRIDIHFKDSGANKEVLFKSDDAGLIFQVDTWRQENCEDEHPGATCQDIREGIFKKSGKYSIEFNGIPVVYGISNMLPHGCERIGRSITDAEECEYASNFLEYYFDPIRESQYQPQWPTGCFLFEGWNKYKATFNRGDSGVPMGPNSYYPWFREICVIEVSSL